MRTSCMIGSSKVMIRHNGELIWGIEKALGIMIQSVDWTDARHFTITLIDGDQYDVIVKREYLR